MTVTRFHGRQSRGVTLIEMLVVISIMVALVGIGIPMLGPAMESRRIREAARATNVFFGAARNEAMASGRPVGVLIAPMNGLPQCSTTLYQAEAPPSYSGDTLDAYARVQIANYGPPITVNVQLSNFNLGLIEPGDLMQFGHQGPYYLVKTADSTVTAELYNPHAQLLPWPEAASGWSLPVMCTVYRQPMQSMTTPLQLPAGSVIDLNFSGDDTGSFARSGLVWVKVMFSPNGNVDKIYIKDGGGVNMLQGIRPIYLLIGKRENLPVTNWQDQETNWRDFHNLWVAINPQSGLVTSSEVASDDVIENNLQKSLAASRAFAAKASSIGGR